ncbi:stalk domain-containing protein [Caldisericum exile]|uniref:stalk domain-containing protein n=1 Tax=Caldisericum exile TaxID=693075 RepID=UPI003C73B23F
MRKFINIVVALTMLLSLVAPFRVQTASAFPTTNKITLTTSDFKTPYLTSKVGSANPDPTKDPYWIFNYFSYGNPIVHVNDATGKFISKTMKYEVYKMGDVIYGYVNNLPSTPNWSAILAKYRPDLGPNMYEAIDIQNQVAGTNKFSLSTGNVDVDGEYLVVIRDSFTYPPFTFDVTDTHVVDKEVVYITYNMTIVSSKFDTCSDHYTINGYLTRGNGQTVLAPDVRVWITYPNGDDAAAYWIAPNSSGTFTITFPADDPADPDTEPEIGTFYIYVLDNYNGYNANLGLGEANTHDRIVYYYISNIPAITMNLSTYITPFIYKNTNNQPILLVLKDQDGKPVTGLALSNFTVTNATVTEFAEISPGFYRFVIKVGNVVDVRFKATKVFYGKPVKSNELVVNTRTLDVYNPYIDITAPNAISPYGNGPWTLDSVQSVYDKLPCTIGNSFEIKVGYYEPADPENWYIYDFSWSLTGPVEDLTGACSYGDGDTMSVLVTQKGKISVSMSWTAWERVNKTCSTWPIGETAMSQNACCHTFEKTVDICEVNSCTVGGVTLSGTNVVDSTTVEVGKKVDRLSVSVDPTGAPADLTCSCPNYVVLMYMVDKDGNLVSDAFTVDTWAGTTAKGSEIWYNPQKAPGPNIPDQPVQNFKPTGLYDKDGNLVEGAGLKFGDCPFNLYGITFNYPTGTSCGYSLVVKVFGLSRTFDACGPINVKYPMIAELFNPITVLPTVKKLSATATIWEGQQDPNEILAGVPAVIDITDPHFSVDAGNADWSSVSWKYYLDGKLLDSYSYCHTYVESGMTVTATKTDTGYRFVFNRPFTTSGTFKIVGTSYNKNSATPCTAKEVVTIEVKVVKPEFTVKIGLMDGSVIDSDGILTEGFPEKVYVDVKDPRGIHDFTTDTNWSLSAKALFNSCGLPTDVVCYLPPAEGCTTPSPITVTGYDNPNIADDPIVKIYFNANGASIKVTSLKLVSPTVKVDPKEVPFTIPATATHVTFTVTDAHGHGAPGVEVKISGAGNNGVNASGYEWWATTAVTGSAGEVDWAFIPPFSGKYSISASVENTCFYSKELQKLVLPCGWKGINTTAVLEAKYKAPVVDTTAPVVTITSPTDGSTVNTATVKVTGTATDNVGVTMVAVNDMPVTLLPDGSFATVVQLSEGANTIVVKAFDAAGNVTPKTVKVTYQKPAPTGTKIVLKIGSDVMTVNDKVVQLDAAPEIKDQRTFLPLRAIAEAFGAQVTWVPETQGITVVLGNNQIGLQIGNNTAVVNGNVLSIVPPYIKNQRTMVPIRVIAEGFGAQVDWDPINYIVTITMP